MLRFRLLSVGQRPNRDYFRRRVLCSIRTPYLTPDLPGIGGKLRVEIDDFIVEEVPAYEPCGEGEHTFFGVEKRDISTLALIQQLARALGVSEREISSAGLKDARAVARQTLCVQWVPPEKILALDVDKAHILWAKRHQQVAQRAPSRQPFHIAHPRRGSGAEDACCCHCRTVAGARRPNGYGRQRFGNRGDNHEMGLLLLRNDRALRTPAFITFL